MPAHDAVAAAHGRTPMQLPGHSGDIGRRSSGSGAARSQDRDEGMGVGMIRDSHLCRQERNKSYKAVQIQRSKQPLPFNQPQLHIIHRRYHPLAAPTPRNRSASVVRSYSTIGLNRRDSASIDQGVCPVPSVSQPTTLEATYSMPASKLSRELTSSQGQDSLSSAIITAAPIYYATTHPSSLDKDSYIRLGGASTGQGFDYIPSSILRHTILVCRRCPHDHH